MAKVRLADIAKEVGCSTATVSYVLNNESKAKNKWKKLERKFIQVSSILVTKKYNS